MKHFYLITLFLLSTALFSQNSIPTITPPIKDTISHWEKKNMVGLFISEILFINWNAGGVSSISGLIKSQFNRNYTKDNHKWANELIMRYGLNKQDGIELRKTEDLIQFNSTMGYRNSKTSHWFYSAKFNFNTQFVEGYKYPNTNISVSGPFAPAYTFFGGGAEYAAKDKSLLFYFSPFTSKVTIVANERLADSGAFGVKKATYKPDGSINEHGEKIKSELGILITGFVKKKIATNVTLENRVNLYSDYINNFGNIDVDYDLTLDLVVNQYVKTNIGAHLLYDDDIKAKEEVDGKQVTVGPKLQLKQMLGVGLTYTF